jgi:hypothetical protein
VGLAGLVLAGCETEVHQTVAYHEDRYAGPRTVVADDDYVYYPQYEMYYSNRRHEYGYRDGNAWTWRATPPRVGVNVIASSPSVHMDFHDSPESHHAQVVKTYPRNWKPADKKRDQNDKNDHKDNDRQH